MVRNAQAQAACLLLLLLVSLASTFTLQQQASQHTDLRSRGTVEPMSETDMTPIERRLWKRDTHFPICLYCCNCCRTHKRTCGFCCRS
ncbi:hepcidin [Sorex araneus]|uniref:hepcidin n=1 Tax=Sorex araneus TaxID=42254 RepID=UPI00243390E6|nr:hepcidin [Sorex araneus]